jgi:hypothetical protein
VQFQFTGEHELLLRHGPSVRQYGPNRLAWTNLNQQVFGKKSAQKLLIWLRAKKIPGNVYQDIYEIFRYQSNHT